MSQEFTMTNAKGTEIKVRFSGKRAEILGLLKDGKTKDEIVAEGFNKSTVNVVNNQAKKLALLA